MSADQFWTWASDTFNRPKKTLRAFMELAFENNEVVDESDVTFATLGDLLREHNKTYRHV